MDTHTQTEHSKAFTRRCRRRQMDLSFWHDNTTLYRLFCFCPAMSSTRLAKEVLPIANSFFYSSSFPLVLIFTVFSSGIDWLYLYCRQPVGDSSWELWSPYISVENDFFNINRWLLAHATRLREGIHTHTFLFAPDNAFHVIYQPSRGASVGSKLKRGLSR